MELPGFQNLFDSAALALGASVLLKLGIGAVLAGLIGYERELHGRPAGLRTHILIALGVILLSEVSRAFAPTDPARIAAQIITGIGFLGAGSILRIGAEIKGLTTAASIWTVAAIGMAISTGGAMIWVAVAATVLTLITLSVVDNLERMLVPHSHPRSIQLELKENGDLTAILAELEDCNAELVSIKVVGREPKTVVLLSVRRASPDVLARLARMECVESASFTE